MRVVSKMLLNPVCVQWGAGILLCSRGCSCGWGLGLFVLRKTNPWLSHTSPSISLAGCSVERSRVIEQGTLKLFSISKSGFIYIGERACR